MTSLPMASQFNKLASSSSVSPTSISKHDYDVFLSFCREDEGKFFTDHLYAALVEKGLHPFKEAISASESLMAIEKSKVFIVIFSRNYADHFNYLLPELEGIIKCREAAGKPVIPVFYHVDASDVRKQMGSYNEAFSKYEAEHEKEKVDHRRNALTKVGNLTGYVLDHGR